MLGLLYASVYGLSRRTGNTLRTGRAEGPAHGISEGLVRGLVPPQPVLNRKLYMYVFLRLHLGLVSGLGAGNLTHLSPF